MTPITAGAAPVPNHEAISPGTPTVLEAGVLPYAKPSAEMKLPMPDGPTSASATAATSADPAAAPASARQSRRATSQIASPIARCGLVAAKASPSQKPATELRSRRHDAYAAARPSAARPSICPRRRNANVPPPASAMSSTARRLPRALSAGRGPALMAIQTASTSRSNPSTDHTRNAVPGSKAVNGSARSAVVGGVMKGRLMTVPAGSSSTCRACSTCWSYSSTPVTAAQQQRRDVRH